MDRQEQLRLASEKRRQADGWMIAGGVIMFGGGAVVAVWLPEWMALIVLAGVLVCIKCQMDAQSDAKKLERE